VKKVENKKFGEKKTEKTHFSACILTVFWHFSAHGVL
jgi:hypothetical protein